MIVGLLSDAHGNLEAFELALRVLRDQGAERIYFLGDSVGYLPGGLVAEAVVNDGMPVVLGNHEAMLVNRDVVPKNDDAYQLRTTANSMSDALIDQIATWPAHRIEDFECGPALLVHGSPSDQTFGYVYPDTDLAPFVTPDLHAATVFMGNTHRPFVRETGGVKFVNIGSCGLPRDVGNLGASCIFDTVSGAATILRFDITEATDAALRRCGPVHEIVTECRTRRAKDFVGELVNI